MRQHRPCRSLNKPAGAPEHPPPRPKGIRRSHRLRPHEPEQSEFDLRALRIAHGGQVGCLPRDPLPGPQQRTVDRDRRCAEHRRHLAGRQIRDVPQNQRRPLPRRQMLQRRDESQPDAFPSPGHLRRIDLQRTHPSRLRSGGPRGQVPVQLRLAQAGGQHPPRPLLDEAQADVRGDVIQPGPYRGSALEPVKPPPRPQERLLHGVLRVRRRTEHPVDPYGSARLPEITGLPANSEPVRTLRTVGTGWPAQPRTSTPGTGGAASGGSQPYGESGRPRCFPAR